MKKRNDGRGEAILEPDLPIIDAHHHLFDRPGARYMLEEFLADATLGHDIQASVFVESHAFFREHGPEHLKPVGETEVAMDLALAARALPGNGVRVNAAIVAFADLTLGALVGETLDAHRAVAGERFRGIRQVALFHEDPTPRQFMFAPPPAGLMQVPAFLEGFAELDRRGLSFDAAVFHTQLDDVAALADRFPDARIVLNHMGFAMGMGCDALARQEVFSDWRAALGRLSARPNVLLKVGGLGMPFWGFGLNEAEGSVDSETLAAAWRPYVETGIELFGADRCMMESNFPADGHSCGYVPLWNALKRITAGCSAAEKALLYSGTAARTYGIELSA